MANDLDLTARDVGVDAILALALRVAAHTADPGGANSATAEVSGGSPAYARKAIAWNAAGGDGTTNPTADVIIDIPAGTTVTYLSFWNVAGTVRYWKKAVTSEVFAGQGTYTVKTTATFDLNTA